MMKQMREEAEKHRKWKADRCKEIMQIKQSNAKKDREIQMLKRENKKRELIAKRKQEELSAMQKKTKNDKQKQINA
jgi:kinesin family protein 4/21/27